MAQAEAQEPHSFSFEEHLRNMMRDVVREELAAHDARNVVTLKGGPTFDEALASVTDFQRRMRGKIPGIG